MNDVSESIRRNFEPGRWLLVSGVILSVVLMLQLYAINETVDISSIDTILGEDYMGMLLIASYVLTTVAMVTVVIEYFSVKKKVDGLLALTQVLNIIEDLQYPARPGEVGPEDAQRVRSMGSLDQAYDSLEEGEGVFEEPSAAIPLEDDGYETVEVKLTEEERDGLNEPEEPIEPEPLPYGEFEEEQVSQGGAEGEEDEVEDMLKQSEVISTLSELERVVDELRTKKPKIKTA